MKKSIYLSLLFILFIFLAFKYQLQKEAFAAECPIKTIGLSRETYNDLKSDPNTINEVKALQTIFSKIPNIGWKDNYKVTGVFGYGTESLLRKFQIAYKLNNTGVIDQATRDKLCEIWEYQNRQQVYTSDTKSTTAATKSTTALSIPTSGTSDSSSVKCVHKRCAEPGFCKDKKNWCCIYYQEDDWKSGMPCVDECDSDQYCIEAVAKRNKAIDDPLFAYNYKSCYRYKCDNNTYQCQAVFDVYVKKDEKCPAELNPSLNECTPPDNGCKKTEVKKCSRGKCYLLMPREPVHKYACGVQTLNVPLNQPCPASECTYLTNYGTLKNDWPSEECDRLYSNDQFISKYCYIGKCDSNYKCNITKVYLESGKTCDDYKSECNIDSDCKPKEKSTYYFDLTSCECKDDSTKGKLTLSECELKKATAIQKQEGGCKGKVVSDDWLKNIDCSLGNYSGSQPQFECEQKLGCQWCPECVQPSALSGGDFADRGNANTFQSLYTGYPGGKCIKINEPCKGKIVKGKCGAECDESFEVVNPISCTTGSRWGNDWAWQNCDDPTTCEARCYYGKCRYTDKKFRERCSANKTREQCNSTGSCIWVEECRGQQLDGPYRPTWYYTGPLQINTCTAWGIYMSDWDYKCVKGKCGAECDDDSDCPTGSRCNLYCKCTAKDSDCIGDSDLGDPFTYGECRNGTIKHPSDYIWKDRCDGPKTLIEATLVDKGNCQCGHQTIDCSKLLVNGICQDGKCVSSTGGEKTYCGCKDFQKICATEKNGGGNIGEKIECRPGSEASCPSCSKSCLWYKCEKNEKGEYRCKQYYEEKVSKEKSCPQSDAFCSDKVIDKRCTPPTETKCSSYGTDFSCYSLSECDEASIKSDVKECKDQNKVCCKKKTTTPTQYTKCQITSYSIGGSVNYTWTCVVTTDSSKNDNCGGLFGQELVDFCTQKYGPPGPTSTGCQNNQPKIAIKETYCDYSNCSTTAFSIKTILAYLRQIFLAASAPSVSISNGECKTIQTVWVCPENKDKVQHECDYNYDCPCPTSTERKCTDFSGYSCENPFDCEPGTLKGQLGQLGCSFDRVCCKKKTTQSSESCSNYSGYSCELPDNCDPNAFDLGKLDCPSGKICCVKKSTQPQQIKCTDWSGFTCEYSSNCEPGSNIGTYDCPSGKVCCRKTTTEKCSNYASQGYGCYPWDQCSSFYNKGGLDCGTDKFCCKKASCSEFTGYSCESSSDCESGTSRGSLDCTGGKVCCIKKSTTGEWCERCSTVKPCTFVRWYDRNGGCDSDWYNQRQEFIKDSCGGCDVGYTCTNGNCVATLSCSAFSGYSCSAENYCESNTSKGKLDCPSGQVCCKPQTPGSSTKCEDAGLKCVNPDKCQMQANQSMYYCLDSSKVCCIIEKTEKCSDYPGYSCVEPSRCKSGTSKGPLNCQTGECCKPIPDCSSYVGYSCNESSQCESGTIKNANNAYCDYGVCCKPKGQTAI